MIAKALDLHFIKLIEIWLFSLYQLECWNGMSSDIFPITVGVPCLLLYLMQESHVDIRVDVRIDEVSPNVKNDQTSRSTSVHPRLVVPARAFNAPDDREDECQNLSYPKRQSKTGVKFRHSVRFSCTDLVSWQDSHSFDFMKFPYNFF